MDYEKEYNEVLKRAKELHEAGNALTKQQMEIVFPQLAESGSENLKNLSGYYKAGKFWKASTLWEATKDKIPQRVPNRYILQKCTWNIGTLQEFADEIKNIQEVSLDYPIILDMNGNILDGAHRVVKAYLEGKDIDIVYLGDDEWPEPDYDEEKAVKESEDEKIRKRIRLCLDECVHSDIIRDYERDECLAYLEKQKEQEPAELETLGKPMTHEEWAEDYWEHHKFASPNGNDKCDVIQFEHKGFIDFCMAYCVDQKPQDRLVLHDTFGYEKGRQVGQREGVEMVLKTPESYGLYKPEEWSEEDEKMLEVISYKISQHQGNDERSLFTPDEAEFIDGIGDKLKSLRPQSKEYIDAIAKREYERGKRDGYWEGYKKAEENHNNSVTFHYDYPTSPSIKRSCYEGGPCTNPQMDCINCPIKSTGGMFNTASSSGDLTLKAEWKPSEEQMKALGTVVSGYDNCTVGSVGYNLKKLYEQLKKLM